MNDFVEFSNSMFYKFVTYFNENIFVEFFKIAWEDGINYFTSRIKEVFSVSFAYGENKLVSSLIDLSQGKFKLITIGNVSTGIIYKSGSKGAYIEQVYEYINGFFCSIGFNIELDDFNFPDFPVHSNVNLDWLPYAAAYAIIAFWVLVLGRLVPA